MIKRLKKLGALPAATAAGVGGGGGAWGGSTDGGPTVPWWLCAVVGALLVPLIVATVQNVRDALRLAKANR